MSKLTSKSQTNVQIFQTVIRIQEILTRIPGQVERQQPVYLIDALGREMAFHLEFVLSAEVSMPTIETMCSSDAHPILGFDVSSPIKLQEHRPRGEEDRPRRVRHPRLQDKD